MDKNIRYIKTYIDNNPKVLCMNTCNLCPFLIFDRVDKMVRCSKFTFKFKSTRSFYSNIIECNINAYSISGDVSMPLTIINIPDWCGLSKFILEAQKQNHIYFKTSHNMYDYVINESTTLPAVSSHYTQYNNKLIKLETTSNKLPAKFEDFKKTEPIKNYPVLKSCSCCGSMKINIDRDKNLGMCDECWEKYKDDKDIKYKSYVNNFRLKRNSTWIKDINKKIEEIL